VLDGGPPSKASDVWAVGAIAVSLLMGRGPQQSREILGESEKAYLKDPSFPVAEALISDLLHDDPLKRLSARKALVE
jgi:serine/threonine protein kinase